MKLYVLVGLNADGRVVQYGPTSESRQLLEAHDMLWSKEVVSSRVIPWSGGVS